MTNNKNKVFVLSYLCTSVDFKWVRCDMIAWIVCHFVFVYRLAVVEGLVEGHYFLVINKPTCIAETNTTVLDHT